MIFTCKQLVEMVTDAREGRLSTIDHVGYRAHLAYCRNCCRYVAQIEQTIAALHGLAEGERAPPEVIAEILAWSEEQVERIIRRYVGRSAAIKAVIHQINEAKRRT